MRALGRGARDEATPNLKEMLRLTKEFGFTAIPWMRSQDWSTLAATALELEIEAELVKSLIVNLNILPTKSARDLVSWPWVARVHALGELHIERANGDHPSKKSAKRPLEVLGMLVDAGRNGASQEWLISRLWPDSDAEVGTGSFHTTMHRLRRLLVDDEAIRNVEGRFTLNDEVVFVDVWALERLLADHDTLSQGALPASESRDRVDAIVRGVSKICSEVDCECELRLGRGGARARSLLPRLRRFYSRRSVD